MPDVGIVLLAAGGSTRMGRPKQLLQIGGQSMLRRAASSAVGSGCKPAIVVLGAHAETLHAELAGLPVTIAVNDAWQRGIGSSIRCGMEALLKNGSGTNGAALSPLPSPPPEYRGREKDPIAAAVQAPVATTAASPRALVILLGDQPLLTADVIRRLVSAHTRSGKLICVSAFGNTFGPPVVIDSRYYPLLLALPDDQGAKALWTDRLDEVHFEPCPEAGIDIDTPGDYERWTHVDRESARELEK